MKILSTINKPINRGIDIICGSNMMQKASTAVFNASCSPKWIQKGLNEFRGWNPNVILLASVISKDAVNCGYYVYQSLNNEKIPEDKRKFVAGMDLANGIMNIAAQLLLFKPFENFAGSVFDKFLSKKDFNVINRADIHSNVAESGVKAQKLTIDSLLNNKQGAARKGLVALLSLVGLQVVLKRIVTPLFATPMATYFKKPLEALQSKELREKHPEDEDKKPTMNAEVFKNFA